jgi:hypothetical protein
MLRPSRIADDTNMIGPGAKSRSIRDTGKSLLSARLGIVGASASGARRTPTVVAGAGKDGLPLPSPPTFGYTLRCAVVVVEGATVTPFVTEASTMLVIGLILSMFGIGLFCWLIFTLAVYALPFFVGLTAGMAAFHSGAGVIGACS